MKEIIFRIVMNKINDTSEAPKGEKIFYRCTNCGGIIPSQPQNNIGCGCRNIRIDVDYFRLYIDNYKKFQVVEFREHK